MKFILGKKQYMTQIFDDEGRVHPATVISAGPVVVTQVRTKAKDGYEAVQVGYGVRSEKRIGKALRGHIKELGNFELIKEFRSATGGSPTLSVGDKVAVDTFEKGERVVLSAVSKGKGFQGVVKRHGFAGGRRSHGQKHSEREPGSIGGGGRAGGRVAKGLRMAGRMGSDRVTLKNVTVLAVDADRGEIIVRGSVPGRRGTFVEIRSEK